MIAVGEPFSYAAEVAFDLPDRTDPTSGIEGHAWNNVGGGLTDELQVKVPGGTWTNATIANIVEKEYGQYALRLTPTQTAVAGIVYVRTNVSTAQPGLYEDVIGTTGGDIAVLGDGWIPFYLPNEVDPIFGAPVTGHTFVAGEVRLCLPNDIYRDANVSDIVEIGNGAYALRITNAAGQTATRGKAFIHADVAGAQPYGDFVTILGVTTASAGGGGSIVTPPSPVPSPYTPTSPAYVDHVAAAINRLCEYAKAKAA